MKSFRIISVFCFFIIAIIGCATKAPQSSKSTLILLSDENGHTGEVIVSTDSGSRVVNQQGFGVIMYGGGEAPSEPFAVSEEEIQTTFKQALSNTPAPTLNFKLYFESGNTVLVKESEAILENILSAIQETASPRVGIVGHSDRAGDKTFNEKLSMRRAETIRKKFIEMGVSPDSIVETTSHGENNPAVWTEDGVAEPRNRRVEVIIR